MRRHTPDPLGRDDDVLTQSETFDEDEMGTDPLEGGMDPAEGWSASDRYGTTALEQATDRPLTERLAEECPDVTGEPADEDGRVLVGDEVDATGESVTRRAGHLVTEPDQPATDEASYAREE